jgi:hypothetical protein
MNNNIPDQPYGIAPNGLENPDSIPLSASGLLDVDGDFAMAAQWEIYQDCDLSSEAIISKFINMENWYYNENTQESVELTEFFLSSSLSGNSNYCWSVRYRDSSLGWSEWSVPLLFETSESQYSDNMLINPGGEEELLGWTVTEGYMESLEAYVCDGIEPHSGDYYFIVGALCNTATYAEAYQEIDVSDYIECIDQNLSYINYGGYISDWGGSDYPEMAIAFIDENGYEIDRTDNIGTYNAFWTLFSNEYQIPMGTRSVQMILMGTRYAGDDNDSYFDDLFLRIWQSQECSILLGVLNEDGIINILVK